MAIIGAGISGIGMAISLQRAGIGDVVIYERADDIGGTWRDNTYPGVGVDVPAQGYQFTFALKPNWSRVFAKGAEVKSYIDECADRFDIRRQVRFGNEVTGREWDEDRHLWRLSIGGQVRTARYVISAMGPFVEPKPVNIKGLNAFRGVVVQSTSWDHDVDLSGKRVAIIGTGASAVQIIPEIAPVASHLDVYQRTPIWVAPKPDFPTPPGVEQLFRRAPGLQRHVRDGAARAMEVFLMGLALEHERLAPIHRAGTRALRDIWYRMQVRDPHIRRQLTPDYDFGCKRPATSNAYLRTFNRGNVDLITDPIARLTSDGVETSTGAVRDIDILVLATGFRLASDPAVYARTPVRGRDGFDLATFLAQNRARSYESVSMPGLPNHFTIFGPYGWVGGTWHDLVETASHHITRTIDESLQRGATCVEVRNSAADRWTASAVERMSHSLWAQGNCSTANSYYYDHHGDTAFVRPMSTRDTWHAARTFDLNDYEFRALGTNGDNPASSVESIVASPRSPASV
ncbi:flavin-containing monooxygenase [Nocardia sp. NPDC055321]